MQVRWTRLRAALRPERWTWRRAAAVVVTVAATAAGIADRPELVIGFLICAAVFIPLEQLVPLVPRAVVRRTAWVDVAHTFGNRLPITVATGVLLAWLAPVARAAFPEEARAALLACPSWVQFVVVLLVTDLANYAAHRALHEVPLLWRLHSVHHSSSELDWLATSRGHPIDQIVNVTALTLPLYALGPSVSFSAAFLAFTFFYPFLAHANTRITLRWLSPVLVTPAFHHWHHAHEPEAVNRNYGSIFSFWDRLFGSWHLPARMPSSYGIDMEVPETWVGQLVHPFRRWPRSQDGDRTAQPGPGPAAAPAEPWVIDLGGAQARLGPDGIRFEVPDGGVAGMLELTPHPGGGGHRLAGTAARACAASGPTWIALLPRGAVIDPVSGGITGDAPTGAPMVAVRVPVVVPVLVCSPALVGVGAADPTDPAGGDPGWWPGAPAAGEPGPARSRGAGPRPPVPGRDPVMV